MPSWFSSVSPANAHQITNAIARHFERHTRDSRATGHTSAPGAAALVLAIPFSLALTRKRDVRWTGRLILAAALVSAVSDSGSVVVMGRFWSWRLQGQSNYPAEWWPMAVHTFVDWVAWPASLLWLAMIVCVMVRAPALIRGPQRRDECPTCNYDLAGITGPCPECGAER